MTDLRKAFARQLTLQRMSPKTHIAYIGAVNGLAKHHGISPDKLTDVQIQDYFFYLLDERNYAWSTCNVRFCGIKSFYKSVLDRDIDVIIPPRSKSKKLPHILSQEHVWKLIQSCENMKHRILLLCAYSAGLRVSEVVILKPEHIDRHRMTIRVEQGKGRKDRETILSQFFLEELETYWRGYQPGKWLFFGRDKSKSIPVESAQKIYYNAKKKAGINKGKGIHTLRHCFATHLIEQGVPIHAIQGFMGHSSITTTSIYLHLTREFSYTVKSPLDALKDKFNPDHSRKDQ